MWLILLLLALAPCLFLLWYFYHRDKYEPEPKKKIFFVFILGCISVIPAAILETFLIKWLNYFTTGIVNVFIMSFFIIAPVEELLKFIVVIIAVYYSLEFDEVMDGIVYTVAASLGFATVENIMYVLSHGVTVGIARAFLAVPGHAFFGAIMGYYLGKAKFDKNKQIGFIILGIFLAVFAHGLYDFVLLTKTVLGLFAIIIIIILGFIVRKRLKIAERLSKQRQPEA